MKSTVREDLRREFVESILLSGAKEGHRDLVRRVLEESPSIQMLKVCALCGAARGGQLHILNMPELLNTELSAQDIAQIMERFDSGLHLYKNSVEIKRFASFLESPVLRKAYMEAAIERTSLSADEKREFLSQQGVGEVQKEESNVAELRGPRKKR